MDEQILANKRILVVEDEMLVVMALEDMLMDLGCSSISLAANVQQALDLIDDQTFDLATLDLNLDGRQSYAVAKALADRGVPFAFSTGYGKQGIGNGYGGRPVLDKPFSNAQLVATLTALLGRDGLQPALAGR